MIISDICAGGRSYHVELGQAKKRIIDQMKTAVPAVYLVTTGEESSLEQVTSDRTIFRCLTRMNDILIAKSNIGKRNF